MFFGSILILSDKIVNKSNKVALQYTVIASLSFIKRGRYLPQISGPVDSQTARKSNHFYHSVKFNQ